VNLAGSDIDADSQRRSPHGGGGLLAMEEKKKASESKGPCFWDCRWLMTPECRDQSRRKMLALGLQVLDVECRRSVIAM
jgi:hypothetical protein